MSRTITSTMLTALQNQYGYKPLVRAELYPSLIVFDALTRDYAITNADAMPASDDPMRQDIVYSATAGLVTFYSDGSLKYALDGDATPVTTVYSSSIKPGVYGNKLYAKVGATINRYSINWTTVAAKGTNPLSLDVSATPTDTPVAIHGISETRFVSIGNDDGGLSIAYFDGTTETLCPYRFMFPKSIDWSGSSRDMESLGLFTTALQLGEKIFVYASNASSGMVEMRYYDLNTEVWSDINIILPTDIDVSLCEFRISNSFVRNNKGYIVGQLIRSDVYETDQPYTLILSSEDGKNFSIDRFSLVSTLGYRFLAIVGSDDNLYLANCNRVCEGASTWVFDGDDDITSPYTDIPMSEILDVSFDADQLSMGLAAGDENQLSNAHFTEGSRIKLYTGYETSSGNEYILFGTYIIQREGYRFADGARMYNLSAVHESQWKLSGLSMPFYAEMLGLSSIYDPMTDVSGKLYAAPNNTRTEESFYVDFWNSEPYSNSAQSITGVDVENFGVVGLTTTASHKLGVITNELQVILGSGENPKLTGTSILCKIYGWSKPNGAGSNDKVNVIVLTCDEDGKDEKTVITTGTARWKTTYPSAVTGTDPIQINVSGDGIEVDRYIKKLGLVFEQSNGTISVPARIEVTTNVEVPMSLSLSNTPWERTGEGTFKVPAAGQPFIMFSQKPYNAFNFFLTSLFENTVTGGISGYPVAVGLIGLAEDASNYILARYDKVTDEVQLVSVRNGLETELASQTPSFSVGDTQGMQFSHRDGHFEVKLYDSVQEEYTTVLTYDWAAADGFMYTSRTITRKCGIYGAIMAPSVQLIGFDDSGTEGTSNSDGMAISPLGDHTDFPSSGELYVEGNIYSYTGKITHPSYIPGPHQLRNTGVYPAPYGNGKNGLECLLLDWNGAEGTYTGKLIALDNGKTFLSAGSYWTVWITTGGQKIWLTNRSRHYSNNIKITGSSSTSTTRVWPGIGGFSGVTLKSGTSKRLGLNSRAILNLSGEIKCYWFMGTGGQHDTTIKDLITTTCALSGAKATFPGDFYDASLTVNGLTTIYSDDYAEGFDLEFSLATPTTFEIRTNVKIVSDNYEEDTLISADTGTKLVFSYLDYGGWSIALVSTPSDTVMYTFVYDNGSLDQNFRILYYENNISVYQNGQWVASIPLDELNYTQTSAVVISAYTAGATDFTNVYVRDLSDWREAIYIDLETDGASAISSIIQERPVEMIPNPDGSLGFYYQLTRPTITLQTDPTAHDHNKMIPANGASDGIVYGLKEVNTIVNGSFAKDFGFSTVLLRFPNLNVGAIEAAYRALKKEYESKDQHSISARPDWRIVDGDVVNFSYTISGTDRYYSDSIIVENCSYQLSQSKDKIRVSMSIKGRGYIPDAS